MSDARWKVVTLVGALVLPLVGLALLARRAELRCAMGASPVPFLAGAERRVRRHRARSRDERGGHTARRRPAVPGVARAADERRVPRVARPRHPGGPRPRAEQRLRDRHSDRTVPGGRVRRGFGDAAGGRTAPAVALGEALDPVGADRGARGLGVGIARRRLVPPRAGPERGAHAAPRDRTRGDRAVRVRRGPLHHRLSASPAIPFRWRWRPRSSCWPRRCWRSSSLAAGTPPGGSGTS